MNRVKAINTTYTDLLRAEGFPWGAEQEALLARHLELLREWNAVASVVSLGDLDRLVENHVADALSLGGVIRRCCGESGWLLDVGSGGGFPVIPLKVLLPGLRVTLVERSLKKVGFLRQVVGELGLTGVEIVPGEFPGVVRGLRPDAITARAVELPKKVWKGLRGYVEGGSVFLWQGGAGLEAEFAMFHVEQVEDAWAVSGLRRGRLSLVRRAAEAGQGMDGSEG